MPTKARALIKWIFNLSTPILTDLLKKIKKSEKYMSFYADFSSYIVKGEKRTWKKMN